MLVCYLKQVNIKIKVKISTPTTGTWFLYPERGVNRGATSTPVCGVRLREVSPTSRVSGYGRCPVTGGFRLWEVSVSGGSTVLYPTTPVRLHMMISRFCPFHACAGHRKANKQAKNNSVLLPCVSHLYWPVSYKAKHLAPCLHGPLMHGLWQSGQDKGRVMLFAKPIKAEL